MEVIDQYEELPVGTSPLVNLTAGALAGIFEHTVTFPLDSLKTRMQNTARTRQSFVSEVRLGNLWRGVWSVVIGAGPAHAIYFATYEQSRKMLLQWQGGQRASLQSPQMTSVLYGCSGAIATILSDAVMTPFDVIKQRLQLNSHSISVFACLKRLVRQEGLRALYLSYPTTLLLNVPFHSIQFPCYELVQDTLNSERKYSPLVHCISGAIAGGVAAAATTPIDALKTVLQTRGLLLPADALRITGTLSAAKFLIEKRGYRGFWAGCAPRILAHMPATAACWTIYEYFKMFLSEK
jgi:solute carrier family 25 (mitochondrial iron transporter), member 28/37